MDYTNPHTITAAMAAEIVALQRMVDEKETEIACLNYRLQDLETFRENSIPVEKRL